MDHFLQKMYTMKMLCFLLVTLISAISANTIDECPRQLCSCPEPNGDGVVSLISNGTSNCFCNCGNLEGSACHTTDDCEKGTACAAPQDFSKVVDKSKGICTSKCMTTRCPEFQKCQMIDNEAKCNCVTYRCTDRILNPVSASRRNDNDFTFNQVFNNICDMINANCLLLRHGGTSEAMWKLDNTHAMATN